MQMKYIYLVNRFHHKDDTDTIIKRLEKASDVFHRDYELRINDSPEEARASIADYRDKEYVLTAIGGDGSINNLLNAMVGSRSILAFLPFGTGNDFYRGCVEKFESGIHDVDIIRINDRVFLNNACFGIDADIANDEHFIHNSFIPKSLRFHAGAIYHFLNYKEGRFLDIRCEGKRKKGEFTTIVAANSPYYGGGYRVSPDSVNDDGMMEVYFVEHISRLKMAKLILSIKNARHLKSPALRMLRTKKLTISSPSPFSANIDGEPLLSDHFDLELIPQGIRIDFDKEFINCFKNYII